MFMDIIVDPSENVYPMIEAGRGHHEMHLSPHLSSDRSVPDMMRHIISVLMEKRSRCAVAGGRPVQCAAITSSR